MNKNEYLDMVEKMAVQHGIARKGKDSGRRAVQVGESSTMAGRPVWPGSLS